MSAFRYVLTFLLGGFVAPLAAASSADCGSLKNGFGPFDYTDPARRHYELPIVEQHHFTPQVAALIKGQEGSIPGDLDYVLRAFPNHARALNSMIRYQDKNPHKASDSHYSVECYFDRAFRFKADDSAIHLLRGIYLHKKKRFADALKSYQEADRLKPNNPEVHYNLGLLYADQKKYDQALTHAKHAYAKGYPLAGLRNRLKKAGVWK
jgi:tetratricopeptide (TPR) repeat protein